MAASEVAICNQALIWVGGNLITSIDPVEDSDESKICAAIYAPLRDAVLEEREWTFAVDRIEPAALVALPKYGFDKKFQIPPNVIRVLQVSRADSNVIAGLPQSRSSTGMGRETAIEWLREGATIVANNATQIYARVLIRIEDTTKFSPAFDQALAARIAMDIAIPIASSAKLQKDMAAMYGEKIALAAASDGMQGRSYRTRSNSLTIVR